MLSHFSRFWLSVTPWNLCIPAGSSSAGFSRQEYWSVLPCLPPGDLPDTVTSPALAGGFFTTSATWEDQSGSQCSWNTLFLYFSCYSYPFHLQVSFSFLLTTLLTYEPGQGVLAPDLVQFSSAQSFSCVQLFATPWTAAHQASLSITNSQNLLKLMSIESVMPSNHLILCVPFSFCLQSFPASGSFLMSQCFTSGGQSIRVSASESVLPMNTKDWSPLGWTGWISLQSKGFSRVFSNTTVQKHQFFTAQLSL